MKLIVGLGNPGKKYDKTRHNAGFFVVDKLLEKLDLKLDQEMFNAHFVTFKHGREKIIIAKPLTFMNLSGQAVKSLMHYFKVDVNDLIVVHDDLDLPLGKIRLRESGSSGGQKGMGNIIDLLHTSDIKRIRIGISNDKQMETADYVLGKFSKEDFPIYEESVLKATDALLYYLDEDNFNKVMGNFN